MQHPNANNENNDPTVPFQPVGRSFRPAPEEVTYPPTPQSYQPKNTSAYPAAPPSSPSPDQAGTYREYPAAAPAYRSFTQPQPAVPTTGYRPAPASPNQNDASQFPPGPLPTPVLAPRNSSRGLRTGAIILLTIVIILVFGVGLFAGWQFGHNSSSTTTNPSIASTLQSSNNAHVTIPALSGNNISTVREAVVADVSPAVVQINVSSSQGSGLGSGVIIDKRGYIVTNYHVVQGAQKIEVVLSDGNSVPNATLAGTDPADDLAVVKIAPPPNIVTIKIGDSSSLKVGQDVMAIGNPLGNTQTVTNGIVSALNRLVNEGTGGAVIPNAIQTDAPINPGNSGGALVDLQGNLVGIPTLTAIDPEFNAPANGVGFAIPSNRINYIVQQLIQNGKVTHTGRAALGIFGESVDATVQAQEGLSVDHGVLITQAVAGGAADKGGLQKGDVIVKIGNTNVDSLPTLQDALISNNPGDKVSVGVYRGTQQITLTVQLGELQAGS